MRIVLVGITTVCLIALWPGVAKADSWVTYTDGRVGGCWMNRSGVLYGCTPQPRASKFDDDMPVPRSRAEPLISKDATELELLRRQNSAYQRQLSEQRAADREQHAQARAVNAYFEAQSRANAQARGARQMAEYQSKYVDCRRPQYDALLAERSLKRHPTVAGMCVPASSKSGSNSVFVQCPPCG